MAVAPDDAAQSGTRIDERTVSRWLVHLQRPQANYKIACGGEWRGAGLVHRRCSTAMDALPPYHFAQAEEGSSHSPGVGERSSPSGDGVEH